jgi:hypothetical protein
LRAVRGRLIFPFLAELRRLDPVAMVLAWAMLPAVSKVMHMAKNEMLDSPTRGLVPEGRGTPPMSRCRGHSQLRDRLGHQSWSVTRFG